MRAAMTVLVLWAAGLGAAAQFGKISVLFDPLSHAYAAQAGVGIGLMVSIVGIVGLIFGTTAGLLVARIGPRRAILSALVLGALISLIQSGFPPYPLMIVTRVLEGFSHLAIVVVAPTVIAAVAPVRRLGLAMSLWSTFFGLTYAILFAIAPVVLGLGGAALLFYLHAAWMVAVAAALWFLLPADPPAIGAAGQSFLAQHLQTYASPRIAAPATGFVFYTVTYVALLTLLPTVVAPEWAATVGVVMPIASILTSLTLGVFLLSRGSAVRVVQLGFGAAAVAGLGLWLGWSNPVLQVVAACAVAAALGLVQGASFAAVPELNRSAADRNAAAGAIAQLGNVGTTIGTPLLALILVQAGVPGMTIFVSGCSLLGIALHRWQAQRRRISAEPARPT